MQFAKITVKTNDKTIHVQAILGSYEEGSQPPPSQLSCLYDCTNETPTTFHT